MDTILFEVMAPDAAMARLKADLAAGTIATFARHTFPSVEHMARILTPLRWKIIEAMTGAGEIGVRELARRVNRDVSAVHADCAALLRAGVIDRSDGGKYTFPYRHVKVRFELHAAA